MKIVIDVDNTIVDYRNAILKFVDKLYPDFSKINNLNRGLSVSTIKNSIKKILTDKVWQIIQAEIYSTSSGIEFYKGVDMAFTDLGNNGYDLYIVSHRTKYGMGNSSNINIRKISSERIFNWIYREKLATLISGVVFCETNVEKIQTIKQISPEIIIDDLEKIHFECMKFQKVNYEYKNILFNGASISMEGGKYLDSNLIELNSWRQISDKLITK